MKRLLERLENLGVVYAVTSEQTYEITMTNSIKMYGWMMILVICSAVSFFLEEHLWFVWLIFLLHTIAMVSCVTLNSLGRFLWAKTIFILDPSFLVILIMVYFGEKANFQYIALLTFVSFHYIFREHSRENLILYTVYLVTTGFATLYVFMEDVHIVDLSTEELDVLKVACYVLCLGLAILLGQSIFNVSRRQKKALAKHHKRTTEASIILHTISENMTDAIFKASTRGRLLFVNSGFVNMFGYDSEDELLEIDAVNLYSSIVEREALMARLKLEGKVSNTLIRYKKKNSEEFWGRLSSTLVTEDGEQFTVGTISDVTARQLQNNELKESERKLREAQSIAKLGNWEIDPETLEMEWSAECNLIFGASLPSGSFGFDTWIDAMRDMTRDTFEIEMQERLLTRDTFEFETWYETSLNQKKYLRFICRNEVHHQSNEQRWAGTVQDITLLKQREKQVAQTHEFYVKVMEALPIGVVLLDKLGRYSYASQNAFPDEEVRKWVLGKTNIDLARYRGSSLEEAELRHRYLQKALDTGQTIRWEEKRVENGIETYYSRNNYPVKFESGDEVEEFIIGYSFDITQIITAKDKLKSHEVEFQKLYEDLDRFIYNISHELRSPLVSVIGLNALAEEAEDLEEVNNLLTMQRTALNRVDAFMRDVVDYSKNRRMAVDIVPIRFKDEVNGCLETLKHLPNYDKVEFFFDIDEEATVKSDLMRIQVLCSNILSNAIQFADLTKDKPFVALRIFKHSDGAIIEVEDNGIGIKEEDLDKVWDMFYQSSKFNFGSGLGLYIAREVAKNIGADIRIKSAFGEGTTLTIILNNLA